MSARTLWKKLVVTSRLRRLEAVVREEIKNMSLSMDLIWENEVLRPALQEGLEKGLEQGRLEGQRNGLAALLRRQLQKRFGLLPAWAEERIEHAEAASLESWGLRVLDASTLEDVFA
jgi:predicted transposase YdaD